MYMHDVYVCKWCWMLSRWATDLLFSFYEWNNWSNATHLLLYDSSIGGKYWKNYSSYRNNMHWFNIHLHTYIHTYIILYYLIFFLMFIVCLYVCICVNVYKWYLMLSLWAKFKIIQWNNLRNATLLRFCLLFVYRGRYW